MSESSKGRRAVRRAGWVLMGTVLSVASFAGIAFAGVSTSMADSFAPAPTASGDRAWPAAKPVPKDRITVAVAVSSEGSVATDVLAPYQVFAESGKFSVYTVAAERRVFPLSGGAHLLPDHTLAEVERGTVPEPDVVVVPAVADPTGANEAWLRQWIVERHRRGARVLGVCAGSELLAASGLLDGRDATSFWSAIDALKHRYPQVHWDRGRRYVEDGRVTTTAGVTSGTVGALRVVEELAGKDEAARIGKGLSYPGWTVDGPTAIPANHLAVGDLPYALNAAFPWLRPTVGIGLVDGVGEIDAAAAFEGYGGVSFTARTVVLGARGTVTTRHGLVLVTRSADRRSHGVDRFVVPGVAEPSAVDAPLRTWAHRNKLAVELPGGGRHTEEFGFDPVLRDLAEHSDRRTALVTAKFSEYPSSHLTLTGAAWPWRSTLLAGAAVVVSVAAGFVPTVIRRAVRRRRATKPPHGLPGRTGSEVQEYPASEAGSRRPSSVRHR
ncbi:DJ-1/PfpI family protein [Streptomyces sp. Ncost-T10-10d]|uniref:DJ-1/PfpI family protein n=1 Tax=Streptomyces sp. Ncost-T10-10d TaxID=1839774 RepID=UPI00081E40EC|nr:DJ-1/PfpI family protein [Streptomyces sp. Ncost-T10-10d]SCF80747.1 DJ-1/PfpI family protein [Streptomyces sp. Ncost-T10-10d]